MNEFNKRGQNAMRRQGHLGADSQRDRGSAPPVSKAESRHLPKRHDAIVPLEVTAILGDVVTAAGEWRLILHYQSGLH